MILGLYGDDKTGKSTLALTFPKPLVHFEFDLGGFDRAESRFKEEVASGAIRSIPLMMPMQIQLVKDNKGNVEARPSKLVVGMKELWYRFLGEYAQLAQKPDIATIAIDTATICWEICRLGFLQEKQEAQLDQSGRLLPGQVLRERLLPIEYAEPNARMRSIYYAAKAYNKHLVLCHHSRDEYKPQRTDKGIEDMRTGQRELAGWQSIGDMADVIVKTYLKGNPQVPQCRVELCGLHLPAVGMEFQEPSYEKINSAIAMMRGE